MTDSSLALVRRFLLERYDELKHRLTARLGSADLAAEALQDAWLNISRVEVLGTIRNPGNYVFGIAMNAARDRLRDRDSRVMSTAEVEGLLEIIDDVPGPAAIAEAKSDWRILEGILMELPPRRREVLLSARLDGMPRAEIAQQMGISLRLVEKELQLAQEYCLRRWKRAKK
jgi:RNA polymerase sigma-70 factor (ECF subfamily)